MSPISVAQAETLIQQTVLRFKSNQTEQLAVTQALGRVLAQDVLSERHQPPFNRISMDGIAISLQSYLQGQRQFKVEGQQKAGEPQKALKNPQNAIECMTGGVLPEGCDVVIRYEDLKIENGVAIVLDNLELKKMDSVHVCGSDHKQGDVVLKKGISLLGPQVGICASNGVSQVAVYKTPKIALVSTGDELVDFSQAPEPHQIRKSNPYALQAELWQFGLKNISLFHLVDEPKEIFERLKNILAEFDILIMTGGVSKGKYDFLPEILSDLQVQKVFHGVTQRPGKPLWFGHSQKGQLVFALPGNPVSCLVCLRRYVLPALALAPLLTEQVYLAQDFKFNKPLTFFLPVKLSAKEVGGLWAHPLPTNGSGDYGALADSDGFIELPLEQDLFEKNQPFKFYSWRY